MSASRGNYPAAPDGWKLVPIEPTQEMCDACTRVLESEDVPGAWAEMLAAALSPGADGFNPLDYKQTK